MKARELEDRGEFCAAIDRLAPEILAAWNELGTTKPKRPEIVRLLARWRLDAPGLEWLADALYQDVRSPTGEPWPDWMPCSGLPSPAVGVLTHDEVLRLSWEPAESGVTRGEFKQRALEALDAYLDRVEEWAEEHGVIVPPPERTRGRLPKGARRWDLLVKHLVRGRSYKEIADEYDVAWSSVGEQVRELASRLGVVLTAKENR